MKHHCEHTVRRDLEAFAALLLRRPLLEPIVTACALGSIEVSDARTRWAVTRPRDQRFDRIRRTVRHRFHSAVMAVSHPAAHAEALRFALHVHPETDTLHAAVYSQVARDHGEAYVMAIDLR
jgi:hypothetical protein